LVKACDQDMWRIIIVWRGISVCSVVNQRPPRCTLLRNDKEQDKEEVSSGQVRNLLQKRLARMMPVETIGALTIATLRQMAEGEAGAAPAEAPAAEASEAEPDTAAALRKDGLRPRHWLRLFLCPHLGSALCM
jgi:hypothetical protein